LVLKQFLSGAGYFSINFSALFFFKRNKNTWIYELEIRIIFKTKILLSSKYINRISGGPFLLAKKPDQYLVRFFEE
jgi:hypothetical protein